MWNRSQREWRRERLFPLFSWARCAKDTECDTEALFNPVHPANPVVLLPFEHRHVHGRSLADARDDNGPALGMTSEPVQSLTDYVELTSVDVTLQEHEIARVVVIQLQHANHRHW